jgi:ATP-binding cassette subfamily F protein 3
MASRAKSKEKQIERLKDVAVEEPWEDLQRINFRFLTAAFRPRSSA